MKMHVVACCLLFLLFSEGCIKSIASEEETIDHELLHNKTYGSSARDLLSDEQFTSLKIEIQYMAGFPPDKDAVFHLYEFLKKHLHKPDGINIVTKKIESFPDTILNRDEVMAVERKNRTAFTKQKQLAIYLLYTNGVYVNDKIFGMAYRNTSVVIFCKNIRDYSGKIGQPNRTKLETTVLLHEMGHLLGLMGKGTPMQTDHEDEMHVSHCKNRNCLMYYSIGTDDKIGYLIKGKVPTLDDNCLTDLKANGGK